MKFEQALVRARSVEEGALEGTPLSLHGVDQKQVKRLPADIRRQIGLYGNLRSININYTGNERGPMRSMRLMPGEILSYLKPDPKHPVVGGFAAHSGNLTVRCGYVLTPEGVILFATTQIADRTQQIWRQLLTSREATVEQATRLSGETHTYLESAGGPMRPA